MTDHVDALIAALLPEEGGYTDDPADPGGETNWGITAFTARAFGYTGAMRGMNRDQASAIYRAHFWVQPGFDKLDAVAPALAARLFNLGVNLGSAVGVGFMQRALNVLNEGGADWPDLKADGQLGALSLAAVRALLVKRGADGARVLLGMVSAEQAVRYMEIAETTPSQERFVYGWELQRALAPT